MYTCRLLGLLLERIICTAAWIPVIAGVLVVGRRGWVMRYVLCMNVMISEHCICVRLGLFIDEEDRLDKLHGVNDLDLYIFSL